MNLKRVLITGSYEYDNQVSQRFGFETRFNIIQEIINEMCPKLKGKIEFYCCFILDNADDWYYFDEKLFEVGVFRRISKAIKQYKAQIIILHTGHTFLKYPEQLLRIFDRLKKQFPELKFGYDKKFYNSYDFSLIGLFEKNSTLFDESEEVSFLEKLVSAGSGARLIELLRKIEDGCK